MLKYRVLFSAVLLFSNLVGLGANAQSSPKKKLLFIGTGGTIAGIAADPKSPSYDPGKVTINAVLEAVPEIKQYADIEGEQLLDTLKLDALLKTGVARADALKDPSMYVNGCSCDMNEYNWRLLHERVERALNGDGYDAVVITHGTDTIEETAFFLEMTVKTSKPVIVVGAVRPSNASQPDGPENIREAVQVAISDGAINQGVMLVMHNQIMPAFSLTEARARQVVEPVISRFASARLGPLGYVWKNAVVWNKLNRLNSANIRSLKFETSIRTALPKVPILWQYVGSKTSELVDFYRQQGARAFVVAGFGMGSADKDMRALFKASALPASDEVYTVSSRTRDAVADDAISYSTTDSLSGVVMAGSLTPYENKVFLQLILANWKNEPEEIRAVLGTLPASASPRDKVRAIYSEFLYRRMGLLHL